MSKGGPDLKRYMDKHLSVKINANRRVTGVLRGYDQFMNIVLDWMTVSRHCHRSETIHYLFI